MRERVNGSGLGRSRLERALADLARPAPPGFELRILRTAGIPEDRYDTYVHLDGPAGGLYVAGNRGRVTGAVLSAVMPDTEGFVTRHRMRTGRTAVPAATPPPGVRPAIRTGRAGRVPIDLSYLTEVERAVLSAVRSVPRRQLRPVGWVAREAGLTDSGPVVTALARNPVHLLIPCHRITYDDGRPCDLAYGAAVGNALRAAEGIDVKRLEELMRADTVFLGSDTTFIFCHPTCSHARRITPAHQVPFRSAGDARRAGYRPCRSCRPAAA